MNDERFRLAREFILGCGFSSSCFFSSSYFESDKDIVWTRFLGKIGRDVSYDLAVFDDGVVVVGWTTSSRNFGDQNVVIVKLSKDEKLLWQRELGSLGNEGANCVEKTKDGGFIAGVMSDSRDGDIPARFGGQDVWLLKFDNQGELLWKRCHGTPGYESIFDVFEEKVTCLLVTQQETAVKIFGWWR